MPAWLWRFLVNFFPCYFFTGASIHKISSDFRSVQVRLPLTWRTRNIVGTIFGGSMYACVDPIYMTMLMKVLGKNYVVWDKAATIRFRKPGKKTLYGDFYLSEEELAEIVRLCDEQPSVDRLYDVKLISRDAVVHAEFSKTLFIARRDKWDQRAKPKS